MAMLGMLDADIDDIADIFSSLSIAGSFPATEIPPLELLSSKVPAPVLMPPSDFRRNGLFTPGDIKRKRPYFETIDQKAKINKVEEDN